MASAELSAKLNDLMNGELRAHNIYLQMAAWASGQNLDGVKGFLLGHAEEERGHMMKFFHYLDDLSAPISLGTVEAPKIAASNVKDLFLQLQKEEQAVSAAIFEVIGIAREERDYPTDQFLQWFAAEQHEEEKMAQAILDKIDLIGDGPNSLYLFDLEIAKMGSGG